MIPFTTGERRSSGGRFFKPSQRRKRAVPRDHQPVWHRAAPHRIRQRDLRAGDEDSVSVQKDRRSHRGAERPPPRACRLCNPDFNVRNGPDRERGRGNSKIWRRCSQWSRRSRCSWRHRHRHPARFGNGADARDRLRMAIGAQRMHVLLQFLASRDPERHGRHRRDHLRRADHRSDRDTRQWPTFISVSAITLGFVFSAAIGIFSATTPRAKRR